MTLTAAKIILCQCQVWSTGRIILTGKIKTLREKPGPVPLCPPQILYRPARKRTRVSVVRGPGLTVRPSI